MIATDDVRLAVIGDVHAHFPRLDRVLERIARERVDGVLLVGDLGSHDLAHAVRRSPERDARYLVSVEEVLRRARSLDVPVLWVPGNHDLPHLAGEGNVDARLSLISGLRVAGIGGAGPARFGFCYEWSEDEVRGRSIPACDLILSHTPPARTGLDVVHGSGEHVGSEAIREIAERHDGALVCGHIHESPGSVQLGRCLCLNVGGLGAPFGRAQVGFVRRLNGRWSVAHEDLESGARRHWDRTDPAA